MAYFVRPVIIQEKTPVTAMRFCLYSDEDTAAEHSFRHVWIVENISGAKGQRNIFPSRNSAYIIEHTGIQSPFVFGHITSTHGSRTCIHKCKPLIREKSGSHQEIPLGILFINRDMDDFSLIFGDCLQG